MTITDTKLISYLKGKIFSRWHYLEKYEPRLTKELNCKEDICSFDTFIEFLLEAFDVMEPQSLPSDAVCNSIELCKQWDEQYVEDYNKIMEEMYDLIIFS